MKWTTWSHPRLSKSKRIYVSWWLVHIYLNLLKDLNLLIFLEYLTFHTDHLSRLRWPPGALFCAGGKADQRSMATGGFVRQYRGILVGFWLDLHHEIRWWRLRESRPFVPLRWKWCTSDHETCPTCPTHGKGLNSNSMCHWHTQLKVALEIVPWIHGTCLYASKSSNKKMACPILAKKIANL